MRKRVFVGLLFAGAMLVSVFGASQPASAWCFRGYGYAPAYSYGYSPWLYRPRFAYGAFYRPRVWGWGWRGGWRGWGYRGWGWGGRRWGWRRW